MFSKLFFLSVEISKLINWCIFKFQTSARHLFFLLNISKLFTLRNLFLKIFFALISIKKIRIKFKRHNILILFTRK